MKKTLSLFAALTLILTISSCSSSDDNITTPSQTYTSFQIRNDVKTQTARNVVAGYRQADNTLKRIATVGDIKAGQTSDKIAITDKNIKTIELFNTSVKYDGTDGATSPLGVISVKENQNNLFVIPSDFVNNQTVDPTDPTQYPVN